PYSPSNHTDTTLECFSVNAQTALNTDAGGPYTIGVDGTVALSDLATLSGGTSDATGTISFTLYDDAGCTHSVGTASATVASADGGTITFMLFSDSACANQVGGDVATAVDGADGQDYTSPPITVNAGGTYYWVASYGGEVNNVASSTACGDENETPLVIKPHISVSKSPDPQTILIGQTATFTITVTN